MAILTGVRYVGFYPLFASLSCLKFKEGLDNVEGLGLVTPWSILRGQSFFTKAEFLN